MYLLRNPYHTDQCHNCIRQQWLAEIINVIRLAHLLLHQQALPFERPEVLPAHLMLALLHRLLLNICMYVYVHVCIYIYIYI